MGTPQCLEKMPPCKLNIHICQTICYAWRMSAKKSAQSAKKPKPEKLTLHSTEAAFNEVKPALDALAPSAIRQPNLNLQEGALVALVAYRLLDTPANRAIVDALGKAGVVNVDLVSNLGMVARAAWFVRHKLDLSEVVHSEAALSGQLVTDALETRKRMLRVLSYHLDTDAGAQSILAGIRAGAGHVDLANDLIALADMYEDHDEEIRGDKKNHRASDVSDARKLADGIIDTLGGAATSESQEWRGYQARAFTLLEKHHEEARRVGRFLYWYDGGDELFPTMFSAVRARPAKKAAEGGEGTAEEESGGET